MGHFRLFRRVKFCLSLVQKAPATEVLVEHKLTHFDNDILKNDVH